MRHFFLVENGCSIVSSHKSSLNFPPLNAVVQRRAQFEARFAPILTAASAELAGENVGLDLQPNAHTTFSLVSWLYGKADEVTVKIARFPCF